MRESAEPLHLVLELDPESEPIRGTVSDDRGHSREYVGWLALIGALEDLRGNRTEDTPWRGG